MSKASHNIFRVIDPHCHLWDLSLGYYDWLDNKANKLLGDLTPINKTYLAQDYLNNTNHENNKFCVEKFIHVEAASSKNSKQEVEWLCEQAKSTPALAGIIGGIDFLNNNLESLLGFYQETKLVKGIRQLLNFDSVSGPDSKYSAADQDYLKNNKWLKNFNLLNNCNLTFEAQVSPGQLLALSRLAEKNSNIIININHAGFPIKKNFKLWQEGIAECAKQENINIKLSGFAMFDHDWNIALIKQIVLFVIEHFGIGRCMFASNFPVDKLYSNYEKMMSDYFDLTSEFSHQDQEKLFALNAERIYQL